MANLNFLYPITLRIIQGYIEVSIPDLKLYQATRRLDELKDLSEIGTLVFELIKKADQEMKARASKNQPLPLPSQPKGAFDPPVALDETLLGMKEVTALLKLSDETIRRMGRKGILQSVTTLGGHRRFRLSEIQLYLKKRKNQP